MARDESDWELRQSARYWKLRAIGFCSRMAKKGSSNIERFKEFVGVKGIAPDSFGEIAVLHVSGKPRRGDRRGRVRTARYRELKALGATAVKASKGCTSGTAFEQIKKELAGK